MDTETKYYYCECDPHGDNAWCTRPCCRSPSQRREEAERIVEEARQARLAREQELAAMTKTGETST
jgi:hypothetical protein